MIWVGGAGDGKVWNASEYKRTLDGGQWPIGPAGEHMEITFDHSGEDFTVPIFTVADSAFALSNRVMKAYPGTSLTRRQELFNKIQRKPRQLVEQGWARLVGRFRIFKSALEIKGANWDVRMERMMRACVLLHNVFLDLLEPFPEFDEPVELAEDIDVNFVDTADADAALEDAKSLRERLADFVSVYWELDPISNKAVWK